VPKRSKTQNTLFLFSFSLAFWISICYGVHSIERKSFHNLSHMCMSSCLLLPLLLSSSHATGASNHESRSDAHAHQ
jgi:hypothetical protein